MKRGLALVTAIFASSPLMGQDADELPESSTAIEYANAVVEGCLPLAKGEAAFADTTPEQNAEMISARNFEYGIDGEIYARFGLRGTGVLNNAIMGNRAFGDDMAVLSIGGSLPGCKVILLSPKDDAIEDEVVAAFGSLDPYWRELPFPTARPGSTVSMRRLIMRDESDMPFFINLIATPIPD
ncbi:MAG: hypothetical protein WA918_03340, partial [Erythrobacter sp.]